MTKKKNRALSLILAVSLMVMLVFGNSITVLAENGDSSHAHPCGAECAYVEGVDCALEHEHDEDCDIVKAVDCDHDEAACEDCPALVKAENEQAPITGSITGFETVELAVEVGTAEEDIPFPSEVTATVQPEGEDAQPNNIMVPVSAWHIAYDSYDPEAQYPQIFQADEASLTLPEGVTLGLDAYGLETLLPMARVLVGEAKLPEPENFATQITSALTINGSTGAGDLANDGWAWDSGTSTLTLEDVDILVASGTALRVEVDATIVLVGNNNSIKSGSAGGNVGLYVESDCAVTIQGSGSLTVEGNRGITVSGSSSSGSFTIAEGMVTATGTGTGSAAAGAYIGSNNALAVTGGSLVASGYHGVSCDSSATATVNGGILWSTGSGAIGYAFEDGTVTLTSGELITGTAYQLRSGSAISLPPVYSYRLANTGDYTESSTPYVYNIDQTYAEFITPVAPDYSWYDGGPGPFTITTAAQLLGFANIVNGTDGQTRADFAGKTVSLGANIDLSTICGETLFGGTSWVPIGQNATGQDRFKGTFIGEGYEVQNLYVDSTDDNQGLFGFIGSGGSVSKLGVTGTVTTTGEDVGGIAGLLDNGIIEQCYSTVTVTGDHNVGGIVGYQSWGMVKDCFATGDVTGTSTGSSWTGGIAGYCYDSTVENCYSTGAISGEGSCIGGIVGAIDESTIKNCVALNPQVDTSTYGASRVVGYDNNNGNTLEGLKARSDMLVNGAAATGGTATNTDGADVPLGTPLGNVFVQSAFGDGYSSGEVWYFSVDQELTPTADLPVHRAFARAGTTYRYIGPYPKLTAVDAPPDPGPSPNPNPGPGPGPGPGPSPNPGQEADPSTPTPTATGGSPQTGDSSNMGHWLLLLIICSSGIAAWMIVEKKRRAITTESGMSYK